MEITEDMIDISQPVIKRWHGLVADALKIVNQRAETGLNPLAAKLLRALILTQFRKDNNGEVIDTQFSPNIHIRARVVERIASKAHKHRVWKELEDLGIVQDRKAAGDKIRKTKGRRAKDEREVWLTLNLADIYRWKTAKRYKDDKHQESLKTLVKTRQTQKNPPRGKVRPEVIPTKEEFRAFFERLRSRVFYTTVYSDVSGLAEAA